MNWWSFLVGLLAGGILTGALGGVLALRFLGKFVDEVERR